MKTVSERPGLTIVDVPKHDLWIHHVWEACRKGDWIEVYFYLHKSRHPELVVHGTDHRGNTALILAAAARDSNGGSTRILNWLLHLGADWNAVNQRGRNALMEAALWGREKNVEELIKEIWASPGNIEKRDHNRCNALQLASTEEIFEWERLERSSKEGIVQKSEYDNWFRTRIVRLLLRKIGTGRQETQSCESNTHAPKSVDKSTWTGADGKPTSTYISTSTQTDTLEPPLAPTSINTALEPPCDHLNDIFFKEIRCQSSLDRVINLWSRTHLKLSPAQNATIPTLCTLARHLQSQTFQAYGFNHPYADYHDPCVATEIQSSGYGKFIQISVLIKSFNLMPRHLSRFKFNEAAVGCIIVNGGITVTSSGRWIDCVDGMLESRMATHLVCILADIMDHKIKESDASHVEPQLMAYYIQQHLRKHGQDLDNFGKKETFSDTPGNVGTVIVWVDRDPCNAGTCEAFRNVVNDVTASCYGFMFDFVNARE